MNHPLAGGLERACPHASMEGAEGGGVKRGAVGGDESSAGKKCKGKMSQAEYHAMFDNKGPRERGVPSTERPKKAMTHGWTMQPGQQKLKFTAPQPPRLSLDPPKVPPPAFTMPDPSCPFVPPCAQMPFQPLQGFS